MRAIIKEPYSIGHVVEVKNEIEELQRIVGGEAFLEILEEVQK